MDILDRAEEYEAKARKAALSQVSGENVVPRTGRCLACGEPTDGGRLFCDADCRDEYEVTQKRRRINGGR